MSDEKKQYFCLLHQDRLAVADPQGLLICTDCWSRYLEERALNLPFAGRPFLRSLINARHGIEKVAVGRR